MIETVTHSAHALGALAHSGVSGANHSEHHGIQVVHWNFSYVREPLILCLFLVSIAMVKIAWHHLKKISGVIPESCMLILLGSLFGALFLVDQTHEFINFLKFSSKTFFLFLLPPIILESSYSLKDRAFLENLGTILLYAVVGTILNITLIGAGIYGLHYGGFISRSLEIGFIDCFVFSSLIAAVDPVAVLAIFEEVGVNKMLFFMVFGESLLNDAVTVVLYNLMVTFKDLDQVGAKEIGLGVASFVCVAGGACIIGFICGFITSFITKFTSKIRVVEPITMYSMAYLSYLLAEMVHFSGIISIICCGIIQAIYAANNISPKSFITVNFFAKVLSSCTESLIFIILGVMLVTEHHEWDTGFVIWSLLLCLAARFSVVYFLTWIVNFVEEGLRKISRHEQFIMSYGGLRGAVSFSLAFMLADKNFKEKNVMLTATMVIIMFTVFIQGITIKPLVGLLRIRTQTKNRSVFVEVNRGLTNHLAAAFEDIIGHRGSHFMHEGFKKVSQKVIRPAIQKHPTLPGTGLLSVYTEVALKSQLHAAPPGMRRNTSAVNAVINSLQVLEQTDAPSCLAETIANAEDMSGTTTPINAPSSPVAIKPPKPQKSLKLKRPNRPAPLNLDNTKDLLVFRDLLNTPLANTVAFSNFDRNMTSSRSQENLKKYAHLLMQRQKYPSTKSGIASILGLMAGTTIIPVIDRSRSEETDEKDPINIPKNRRSAQPRFISLDGTRNQDLGKIAGEEDTLLLEKDEKRPLFTLEDLHSSPRGRQKQSYPDNNNQPMDKFSPIGQPQQAPMVSPSSNYVNIQPIKSQHSDELNRKHDRLRSHYNDGDKNDKNNNTNFDETDM